MHRIFFFAFLLSFPVYTYNIYTQINFFPVLGYLVSSSIISLDSFSHKVHIKQKLSSFDTQPASHTIIIVIKQLKTATAHPPFKSLVANSPHQPNGSPSRGTANHNHLQSPLQPGPNIILAPPARHHRRLDPSKHKQRHRHHTNAPIQRHINLTPPNAKVWNQWDQSSQEISHRDGDGAYKRSGSIRWRGLVMETH